MASYRKPLLYAIVVTIIHAAIFLVAWKLTFRAMLPPKHFSMIGEYGLVFCDVAIYHDYATRIVWISEIPYRDFVVEYPILSLPFLILPLVVSSLYSVYQNVFIVEMLLFDLVTAFLIARWVGREGGGATIIRRLAWYSAFFAAMCPMILGRFDLVPMTIAFAATYWWATGREALGGAAAGVGAFVKIYPGLVACPALVRDLFGGGRPRTRGAIALAATVATSTALWFAVGGAGVAKSLGYHAERGLEVGSIYSSVIMVIARIMKVGISTAHDHSSINLLSPWSASIASLAMPIQAAMLLFVLWRFWRTGMRDLVRYSAAALLAFLATGKVGSPQYVILLFPFIAVLEGRTGTRARWTFLACCLLTTAICPWAWKALLWFRWWAVSILLLKNLLLLALLGLLLFGEEASTVPEGSLQSDRWASLALDTTLHDDRSVTSEATAGLRGRRPS
jgi:hypothetical protein